LTQETAWAADAVRNEVVRIKQATNMIEADPTAAESQPAPRSRHRFTHMAVGDSILIDDFRLAQSARVSAINFIKRHELAWKFGIRKTGEGWRIYRLH